MRPFFLVPVLCLAACAPGQYSSYVGPIDPHLVPQVAADMADFVNERIKPSAGPIQVEQPDGDQVLGPVFVTDLQQYGFTIAKSGAKHRIRYAASTLGDDVVARVSVDHADGARMYRDKPIAGLSALGPFTVVVRGE